jgi:hypothetical protein
MELMEHLSEAARKLTALLACKSDTPVEHSFTEYELALIWLRLRQQGLDNWLFPAGDICSYEKFKECALNPSVWCYAGFSHETGEPCALALLDGFQGKTARLHYTFFRNEEALRDKEKYARAFFDLLFENKTLDALLLGTPKPFRHSNSFARYLGAVCLGDIPSLVGVKNWKTGELSYPLTSFYTLVSPHYNQPIRM